MPLFDFVCPRCDITQEILFFGSETHHADCDRCGKPMEKQMPLIHTPEWGGPQFDHAAQRQFGSRSEQQSYWKQNGFREAGDKVGGARNEDNLKLGKTIVSDPKLKTRRSSAFANRTAS